MCYMILEPHTHSYFECVKSLDFPMSSLPYEVIVSTPTDKPITTSSACLDCSVMVDDNNFSVNLIFFPSFLSSCGVGNGLVIVQPCSSQL